MTYDAAKEQGRGCVWVDAWRSLRTSREQVVAPALHGGAWRQQDNREFGLTRGRHGFCMSSPRSPRGEAARCGSFRFPTTWDRGRPP